MRSEQELISRLPRYQGRQARADLPLGIGDDCAIFHPAGAAEDLLFTTDLCLENVHFRRETHTAADVGYKTLARGLSDIAAMGGVPRFCLLSLALPPWADEPWVDGFYEGLLTLARKTGTALAGGDLARDIRLAADIVVCGAVPRGQALRRDGGRPGDILYCTGRLGGSALGLANGSGPAWERHVRPTPRLALGQWAREVLRATASMDLSDGLSLDLHRLALASGVAAQLERVPVYPGATVDQALHGGEDYELLLAVPPTQTVRGRGLLRIGTLVDGEPGAVMYKDQSLTPQGWDHFQQAHD